METFTKKENGLPSGNIGFLCQCLEKGGKTLADSAIGLAKNGQKNFEH